jgi:hypothetical protein
MVQIEQHTSYPVTDRIDFTISPEEAGIFTIAFRIPGWSQNNALSVNGKEISGVIPGSYQKITRLWNKGDKVSLTLDLRARLAVLNGFQAVIRGPVVLSRDSRFADKKPENIWIAFTAPMVVGTNLEGADRNPRPVHLCDFASAGNTWEDNSRFRVWLKETLNVMNMNYMNY